METCDVANSSSLELYCPLLVTQSVRGSMKQDEVNGVCVFCVAGLFEQRAEQYLEELPDTEQSGVNKFLKGLGEALRAIIILHFTHY